MSALKNDIHADVCPNASTFAALKRKFAATPVCKTGLCKDSYIHFYTTEYVLTTGNNWDGPIGTFHLILDKLKPKGTVEIPALELPSLCAFTLIVTPWLRALKRRLALQPRVESAIHFAHTACTQGDKDFVGSDVRSRC